MRVHLPALIALASASAYVACGSSDASRAEQEGGAAGEAGQSSSSGGKNGSAGSQNGGGSLNDVGGQAGSESAGAVAGQGGQSELGVAGEAGAAGSAGAGAGGEAGAGNDTGLPAACPGVLADYTTLLGTVDDDTFSAVDVGGKKLIFGLAGADTFPTEHGGDDCLVGGPGDDDFTNSDEFANYYVGGSGADVYHLSTTGNYVRIADMSAEDELSLKLTTFTYLLGVAGDTVNANQIHSVAGYSTGTSSGVVEGSTLVYDPTTGELWQDYDGGVKGSNANDKQILTILNHDGYVFDIDDFVLE